MILRSEYQYVVV